ncbi:MAG: RagB/SusD family nutrient uptake outer membrane protein [Bacteroidales bacterium]|nr:RagB/SusD family nutrient uptake outer membrane protein [Bacteroidales bacterium]
MKTLFTNPTLFAILVMLVSACNDDILFQDNPNQETADQFWKTQDDAIMGINAVYSALQDVGTFGRWHTYVYDCRSDEVYNLSPWTELQNYTKFTHPNYNFETNMFVWWHMYVTVYRANQILDNVPEIDMDPDLKNRILAEATFLRALTFFHLGTMYGNVPIVLTESTPEDRPMQNTQPEVYQQVIDDLTDIYPNLPDTYPASDLGRATKGAARALLGKVYMQQHKWQEAATEFEAVINSPAGYALTQNYKDNFTDLNENNEESIFEIQFAEGEANCRDCPGGAEGSERAIFFAPSEIGWNEGHFRPWVLETFFEETTISGDVDPRLAVTMFYNKSLYDPNDPDTLVYGKGYNTRFGADNEKTWFRKYQNDYKQDFEAWQSGINCRLIRLADIYLLYAEAMNELNDIPTAIEYIDYVRERSDIPGLLTVKPSWTKDEIRSQLQNHERVLELAGEGTRWFDLVRWGWLDQQAEINNIMSRDEDFSYFEVGKSIFLPIPTHEVDVNPNLIQNPGY